ncbi:glycoside hydrolase family 88/105 protein [Cohnella nanjingensis]|uniref:Glycoside hydrolase family 88 protein n=1 Tax=Cohnella nanjingensis TaxID=1387779 RepID=A0A7X0VDQ9_9BACL|nr:glycoside hydrolase family 88 protein [Cohnella nanjingensis]MBB6669941.1 glycoside hydrolase family 88 protein [Cohnella nanjingensis]
MTVYMEPRDSARYAFGDDDRRILELLSGRYVGANPPVPFALRAFSKAGVLQTSEGLYDMDLSERLPQATIGDYAYLFGLVWSDGERAIDGLVEPFGPTRLYLNAEQLYRSSAVDEMKPDARIVVPLLFRRGWNELLIEVRRTAAGFGCRFGADEAKVRILNVLSPFADRSGSAGWVFSQATRSALFGSNGQFPDGRRTEEDSGLTWLPQTRWSAERQALPNMERLYGRPDRAVAAYGWTRLETARPASIVLRGEAHGPTSIWLNERLVVDLAEAGTFRTSPLTVSGSAQLLVRTINGSKGWGFDLEAFEGERPRPFLPPAQVHGYQGVWLYSGPVASDADLSPASVCSLSSLLPSVNTLGSPDGYAYWTVDMPQTRVRPFYENAMLSNKWTTGASTNYGRWDYPLGVTMYGLLRSARTLKRRELSDYALSHIRSCADMYAYALWDRDEYGFPSVNQQLVMMRMLDNCGSFGSAMLEAHAETGDEGFLRIAGDIAEFMLRKLERRGDGAFYRQSPGEYFDDTMWADDLYMSAPFLSRYTASTGSQEAIDEAAKQFLLFRRYLFMEDQRIMSHVFDFKYGQPTRIPWGRGNGWVLFSLTELLEKLPSEHPDRERLLDFFNRMCAGVLALQGESGLWRQVLNEPEAYEEASCTAMFAYAFARGVRYGWLDNGDGNSDAASYAAAAVKAWRGLTTVAIDRQGNVHGVCSGSRYSYSPDYYMYDLRTVVNDNHGIGIMMLAGVEISLLKSSEACNG